MNMRISNLPRTTRLRLAIASRIDAVGGWLCGHGHQRVAELMWRTCRMW